LDSKAGRAASLITHTEGAYSLTNLHVGILLAEAPCAPSSRPDSPAPSERFVAQPYASEAETEGGKKIKTQVSPKRAPNMT